MVWPLASIAVAVGLAAAGALLMKERFETREKRYSDSLLSVEGHLKAFGWLQIPHREGVARADSGR